MKSIYIFILLSFISSQTIFAEEITPANNPLPNNYIALIEEEVRDKLIDPESARFKIKEDPIFQNGKWLCKIYVNAKNKFGGYIGFEEWWCYIDYGKVIDCDLDPYTSIMKITQ